jgi:hypothetical protein
MCVGVKGGYPGAINVYFLPAPSHIPSLADCFGFTRVISIVSNPRNDAQGVFVLLDAFAL